jgi:hypothetical protein
MKTKLHVCYKNVVVGGGLLFKVKAAVFKPLSSTEDSEPHRKSQDLKKRKLDPS